MAVRERKKHPLTQTALILLTFHAKEITTNQLSTTSWYIPFLFVQTIYYYLQYSIAERFQPSSVYARTKYRLPFIVITCFRVTNITQSINVLYEMETREQEGKRGEGMLEHGICTALWSMARADLLVRIIQTRASIDEWSNDINCATWPSRCRQRGGNIHPHFWEHEIFHAPDASRLGILFIRKTLEFRLWNWQN